MVELDGTNVVTATTLTGLGLDEVYQRTTAAGARTLVASGGPARLDGFHHPSRVTLELMSSLRIQPAGATIDQRSCIEYTAIGIDADR